MGWPRHSAAAVEETLSLEEGIENAFEPLLVLCVTSAALTVIKIQLWVILSSRDLC